MKPLQVTYSLALTLLIFGAFIYFESGKFILPLGIFKPLLAVGWVIQFFMMRFERRIHFPLVVASVLLLASSKFVLELILTESQMQSYFFTATPDLLLLTFMLIYLLWSIRNMFLFVDAVPRYLFLTGNAVFVLLFLLNLEEWSGLGLLLSMLIVRIKAPESFAHAAMLLFFFLVTATTVTGFVYGKVAVMANL